MTAFEYNYHTFSSLLAFYKWSLRQMFCQCFSNDLCTTLSLVDNKPYFFQPCQINCTVLWELVYHSEWKNDKVVSTIRCCSFFVIADNDLHTIFPGFTSATWVVSVLKEVMLPLQEELWRVFSLQQQTFPLGGLPTEEAIKTSAMTITQATKSLAMLWTLNFNT